MSKRHQRMYLGKSRILNYSVCSLAFVFVAVLLGYSITASASTSAVSTSASSSSVVTVNVSDILSMRLLNKTASTELSELTLSLTPTPSGAFTKNSLLSEVSTSNTSGYTLYLTSNGTTPVGSTEPSPTYTTALVNTDSTVPAATGTIPTLPTSTQETPTSVTEAAFRMSNSTYKNRWGYSTNSLNITQASGSTPATITDVTDTSAITYADVPAHGASRAIGSTSNSSESHLTPVTIGVNASNSVVSGAYQNILEFTATANAIPTDYSITFNINGSDTGNTGSSTPSDVTESTISGMPTTNPMTESSLATSYTFTLPSTAPETSVSGYVFRGWNTKADGTGTSYNAGSTVTLTVDDQDPFATQLTLYAIWGQNNFWSITYMQEMTPEICNSVYTPSNATGSSVTMITDQATYESTVSGDNQPYVAQHTLYDYRGRDGTGTESSPATGSNMQSYVVRKLADGNCWMTENLQLNLSTSHSYKVGTFTGGEADWTPNSNTSSTNPYNIAITQNYRENIAVPDYRSIYHNNWYYTWHAAVAASSSTTQTSYTPTQSICPKGWRLPLGDTSNKSFYYLITTKYGQSTGNAINNDPLNFYPAGSYYSGSLDGSANGYYWSATSRSGSNAYGLNFSSSSVYPQRDYSKFYGLSVRCVSL